jgi:alpha-galactosidase
MTHYFPDEPEDSQIANIASLILGQNGVWGDLPALSEEAVARFGSIMARYKEVRDDITESYPVRSGDIAGTPEIHEKISERTGRGAVVVFATAPGRYEYVTRNAVVDERWHTGGVEIVTDDCGRARLTCTFQQPGAKIVLFGAS